MEAVVAHILEKNTAKWDLFGFDHHSRVHREIIEHPRLRLTGRPLLRRPGAQQRLTPPPPPAQPQPGDAQAVGEKRDGGGGGVLLGGRLEQ